MLNLSVKLCVGFAYFALLWACGAEARTVKIGILAFRPIPEVHSQYAPLIKQLNQAIPEHTFEVVACNYQALADAISTRQLDFVLTNPAHYVQISKQFELTAPLATLINPTQGNLTQFGGVIVVRADRADLQQLTDLKHKKVAGVAWESFGGFQVQAYELALVGLDFSKDYALQFVGMPHDAVVQAVLAGQADAGFVRTGVIEGMLQSGMLTLPQIKIIHPQHVGNFPQLLSTGLYPEWPLVAMATVDEQLVRHLTATVLDFNRGQHFFATPSLYASVEEILRELRLAPFDQAPKFTMLDIWLRYRWQLVLVLTLGLLIVLLSLRLTKVNGKLEAKRVKLESEMRLRYGLLDTMNEGVYGVNHQGICTLANPAAQAMLGYSEAELLGHKPHALFHHHRADGGVHLEHECPIMQTLLDGKSRSGEDWFIRKDGEGFPVSIKTSAHLGYGWQRSGAVVVFHDISDQKREEQRVFHLAYHDALTGLPNRPLFDDRLSQALAQAKRDEVQVAMMFVDLDKFKPVNDTFGHHVGDLLLIEVAQRLQANLRDSDTAVRIGGDEFVVLLPSIKVTDDAVIVAEKILSSLREPFELAGAVIGISASIGVAIDTQHECDHKKLRNRADAAMYRAKERGRNNVVLYQDDWYEHNWSI